jgi:hypothetical protein
MAIRVDSGYTIADTLNWLYRDYILAQHTITALEKWRARQANTFHFEYHDGQFDWLRHDTGGRSFTASRFGQARNMLTDLGLLDLTQGKIQLTQQGKQIYSRVLETFND